MGPYEQSEDECTSDCIWQNQYLSTRLIDCIAVIALCANDFLLSLADRQLRGNTVRYTISGVLSHYFAKAMRKQKVELDGMLFMSFLIIYIC